MAERSEGTIMADRISEYLASYTTSATYEDLPPTVVRRVKGLLIDTLGCGIAGYASEPGKIARSIAEGIRTCDVPATLLGTGQTSSPELATFANGVMIRCLDLNDSYSGQTGAHPSDTFAPVLTCADAVHAGGKEMIIASVLAYEVFGRFCDQIALRSRGFDHSVIGVISCVTGVSRVLGLSREQMIEAMNIAISASISLGQIRIGEVSMWKSCALANAARNAVFAAMLAKKGMTGPSGIFEGRYGLINAITGPFQLEKFGGNGRPFRIMDVSIKRYPCGSFAQTAVDAALNLRSKISDVNDIAEVMVWTTHQGKIVMAGDAEKWRPETRESADHSLPYVIGIALMCGCLETKHFTHEYLHHPDLIHLLQKIRVEESEECNDLFPATRATRVELRTKAGERFSERVDYHLGHYRKPVTEEEIERKFHSLTSDLLSGAQRKELLSCLWSLEQVEDVGKIMALLKI